MYICVRMWVSLCHLGLPPWAVVLRDRAPVARLRAAVEGRQELADGTAIVLVRSWGGPWEAAQPSGNVVLSQH